jgi:hypothetical protein
MDAESFSQAELEEMLRYLGEAEKYDPNGVFPALLPLYNAEEWCRGQGYSGRDYESLMVKSFGMLLRNWAELNANPFVQPEDIFWLVHVATDVGIGHIWRGVLVDTINNDPDHFADNVRGLYSRVFPQPEFAPQEFAALILAPPDKLTLPPGHPVWLSRGVRNIGEWQHLAGTDRVLRTAANADRIARSYLKAMRNNWMRKVAEHPETSDKAEREVDFESKYKRKKYKNRILTFDSTPDDSGNLPDRLTELAESVGLDMAELTPGEQSRLLGLFSALDGGISMSSKQGLSLESLYGERADSEKTQRSRLFKKIRGLTAITKTDT